jgi:acyl carrier protein
MIFDRLKEVIAELFSAVEGDISEDTDLYEDLYADSLDMYELSIILEEEFDLTRRDIAKMKDFCTVGEILNYITEK